MQRAICVVARWLRSTLPNGWGRETASWKIVETSGYHITLDISDGTLIKAIFCIKICLFSLMFCKRNGLKPKNNYLEILWKTGEEKTDSLEDGVEQLYWLRRLPWDNYFVRILCWN